MPDMATTDSSLRPSASRAVKAVVLDLLDTYGEFDPVAGRFEPHRPSTEDKLRVCKENGIKIGVIAEFPADMPHDRGVEILRQGILSQATANAAPVTVGDYIDARFFTSNHSSSADKRQRKIYLDAAKALGVDPSDCRFDGLDDNDVTAAEAAGLCAQQPLDAQRAGVVRILNRSRNDSGRQFQAFFEHEHLLGERIFGIGDAICAGIHRLVDGRTPKQIPARWQSPPRIEASGEAGRLRRAMSYFVFLLNNFANQVHLVAEEQMFELAVGAGMPRSQVKWVFDQHDQARAYWAGITIAWRRICEGDADDQWYAHIDFMKNTEAFIFLFRDHAVRENNSTYTLAGKHFNDMDDMQALKLGERFLPPDMSLYVGIVQNAETLLGISA